MKTLAWGTTTASVLFYLFLCFVGGNVLLFLCDIPSSNTPGANVTRALLLGMMLYRITGIQFKILAWEGESTPPGAV